MAIKFICGVLNSAIDFFFSSRISMSFFSDICNLYLHYLFRYCNLFCLLTIIPKSGNLPISLMLLHVQVAFSEKLPTGECSNMIGQPLVCGDPAVFSWAWSHRGLCSVGDGNIIHGYEHLCL